MLKAKRNSNSFGFDTIIYQNEKYKITVLTIVILVLIYLAIAIFALNAGTVYYRMGQDTLTWETIHAIQKNIETQPLNVEMNPASIKCLLFLSAGYIIGVLYYYTTRRKFMMGKEHGSAKWATEKEMRKLADEDESNNVILTNDARMSLNTRKTLRNLNMLVIGGSGSGKTRFFVKPNLMQHNTSYVVTDPKGELLRSTATMLKEEGYDIKVFNLIDMKHSNTYNPFEYINPRTPDTDIEKLIKNLIKNTTPPKAGTNDPFWENAETVLLKAIMCYLYHEAPKEEQNFEMVMELLRAAEIKEEDEDYESVLDILFKELEKEKPNHIAVQEYHTFKSGAGKTTKSILISLGVRLSPFNLKDIRNLTRTDNIDLTSIGDKKTALFVVIPDSDSTFNFLVAMLYSQLFDKLYYRADFENNGRLDYHVRFMLDEFANIGEIPDFEKKVATMRSREISASIIIQNLAQLKTMYKDSWESITGNCDTILFLGGKEQSTLEYISKAIGKTTIETKTTGLSRGRQGSSSINYGIHGRELMTPEEIGTMPNENCILLVRGYNPHYSRKFIIEDHPNYERLEDHDPKNAFDYKQIHTISDIWEEDIQDFQEMDINEMLKKSEEITKDAYQKIEREMLKVIEEQYTEYVEEPSEDKNFMEKLEKIIEAKYSLKEIPKGISLESGYDVHAEDGEEPEEVIKVAGFTISPIDLSYIVSNYDHLDYMPEFENQEEEQEQESANEKANDPYEGEIIKIAGFEIREPDLHYLSKNIGHLEYASDYE